MSINHILIVLGKRLNNNLLTKEGSSRVEALHSYLLDHAGEELAVAFCGGVTSGQSASEASRMHHYFRELESTMAAPLILGGVLLEEESTNTVENIQNVAKKLIESQLLKAGQPIRVTFVSNDYHLHRIFEIQQLMDEQGLLRVLKTRCEDLGIQLQIDNDLSKHVTVSYPHQHLQGQLFLLMDELTTYRVYLEGVAAGSFKRDLQSVREMPVKIATAALNKAQALLLNEGEFPLLRALMPVLSECVVQTPPKASIKKVREYLALLDTNLTLLNRYLDPEVDSNARWWR